MRALKRWVTEYRVYLCNHWVNKIPSHGIRLAYYKKVMGFEIHPGAAILLGARFDCAGGFSLGTNSVINENCRLDNRGGLHIGENVSVSAETIILTADHDPDSADFAGRTAPVRLEDYCFVGTRCLLLKGVTLGKGSVVAAGSVVTKSVEPFMVAAGVPAKPMRKRACEPAYQLGYRRLFH